MAIVKCKICRTDIEESVERCPHCDSLGPKKSRRITCFLVAGLIVLAIVVAAAVYWRYQQSREITRESVFERKRLEKIQQRVLSASFLLKTNIKNNNTIKIDKVQANSDGSVLCYQYRLVTHDGTMEEAKAVFAEGDFHHATGSWEIYCTDNTLTDVTLTEKTN